MAALHPRTTRACCHRTGGPRPAARRERQKGEPGQRRARERRLEAPSGRGVGACVVVRAVGQAANVWGEKGDGRGITAACTILEETNIGRPEDGKDSTAGRVLLCG